MFVCLSSWNVDVWFTFTLLDICFRVDLLPVCIEEIMIKRVFDAHITGGRHTIIELSINNLLLSFETHENS